MLTPALLTVALLLGGMLLHSLGFAAFLRIASGTVPARQALMPALNRATAAGATARRAPLHGLSGMVALASVGIAGYALARFVGMGAA